MSKSKYIVSAVVALVAATSNVASVYAWHPKGQITKSVQNQTTGSAMSDANTTTTAVNAKPGDVLKYTITIKNTAPAADKHYNDLAFIKLTDTLPAGVELASNPSTRTISADLGTLIPGKSVTKEYLVKVVTSAKNAQVIENKACFTGDSVVRDNPQAGCDTANVKVTIPETPPTTVTPTPQPQTTGEVLPATLPSTGIESVLGGVTGIGALTYAAASYIQSRRKR
jgi:uncharacterized repeat protein (TIGR01451 family)